MMAQSNGRRRGGRYQTLYQWDRWFMSGEFTIVRGRDYLVKQGSMVQQIRNAASERGLKITIVEFDDPPSFSVAVISSSAGEARYAATS